MPDEENQQNTPISQPEPAPEASPTSDVGSYSVETPPDKQEPISQENSQPITPPNPLLQQEGEPETENEIKIPEPTIEKTPDIVTVTKTPDTVTITEVMPIRQAQGEQPLKVSKQKNLWQKFLEKTSFNKKKKLDRIMKGIETTGKTTNDEVEKNLRVSHATATRYLDILEKEGKIRQVGKTGKYTNYEKI